MAPPARQVHRQVTALAAADLPLGELGAELSVALRGLVPREDYCLISFRSGFRLRAFLAAGRPAQCRACVI